MQRVLLLVVLVAAILASTGTARAADVYESSSKVGSADRGSGSRYDIKSGYSRVGYTQQTAGRWNVYESYSKVGYVQSSGSRWNIYSGDGEVRGSITGGPAAAAALLLLIG